MQKIFIILFAITFLMFAACSHYEEKIEYICIDATYTSEIGAQIIFGLDGTYLYIAENTAQGKYQYNENICTLLDKNGHPWMNLTVQNDDMLFGNIVFTKSR